MDLRIVVAGWLCREDAAFGTVRCLGCDFPSKMTTTVNSFSSSVGKVREAGVL